MVLLVAVHAATGIAAAARSPRVGWVAALVRERPPWLRVAAGGLDGARVADGEVWRLATAVLVHGDGLHLLVNVLALLALGRLLEPRVGTLRWLAWFAAGGLAGSAAAYLAGAASNGASGGVFALLGAGVVLGWRWRAALPDVDRRMFGPILWAALAVGVVSSWVVPAIDPYAHVGGLAAGAAAAQMHASGRSGRVERERGAPRPAGSDEEREPDGDRGR